MTYQHLWQRLTPLYDINEAQAIIRMVLEEEFHLSFADILIGKVNELSQDETFYEIIALPITIKVVKALKEHEGEDVYDEGVNYSIWKIFSLG